VAKVFSPPATGDIVWCRFPENKALVPGPKPRPGLVVRVGTIEGEPAAAVSYGTSKRVSGLRAGEFSIARVEKEAFVLAGLSYDTKFNLAEVLELPFNDEWFAVPPRAPFGQSPKLGVLHPSLMHRAEAAFRAVSRSPKK
jgi:hypothetical protein